MCGDEAHKGNASTMLGMLGECAKARQKPYELRSQASMRKLF